MPERDVDAAPAETVPPDETVLAVLENGHVRLSHEKLPLEAAAPKTG